MDATLEAPAVEAGPEKTDTLIVTDRCDQCGSQAYVGVLFEKGELMFCAHHYAAYELTLSTSAIKVFDERWKLSAKPLDVSA